MSEIPGAGPVRSEDSFDVAKLTHWLSTQTGERFDRAGEVEVHQFTGGASNVTFLVRYEGGPEQGGRDLIVRRAPRGTKAKSAHDMLREYTIQTKLAPVFAYVPAMVAFCDDESILGAEFYVMDRAAGTIPGSDFPAGVSISAEQARKLCHAFVDVLAELHGIDAERAGLGELGKGPGYVGRQVEGWSARYRNARTPDVPDLESVMAWLATNQPADVATCLIHNDFKLDNLVLDPDDVTRIIGVIDWEMATLGDPWMDLAGSLAYWVQADDPVDFQMIRRIPTHLPGMMTREEIVAAYAERTGRSVSPEQWRFYEVFGLFRLAVIAQQIYYRFFHKQTTNPSYEIFAQAVHILSRRIDGLIT